MIFYGPELEARTVFELELDGFGGEGPPIIDESGWPNTAEVREFELNAFRLRNSRVVLQRFLLTQLQSGELFATGFSSDTSLGRNAERIASDRWRILQPDFETSQARSPTGIIAGILVYSLTVTNPSQPTGRYSMASLRGWYLGWVRENMEQKKMPSRHDDWQAAKAAFGGARISRDAIRELRREIAPAEWKSFGRRRAR